MRGYTDAAVYTFPGHERLGSFPLPPQKQGEGIAVGPDGRLYLSTEGQFTDVLRTRVPADIAATMAPPKPSPSAAPTDEPGSAVVDVGRRERSESEPPWPWLVGGGLAFVVAAGWLLVRHGQAS